MIIMIREQTINEDLRKERTMCSFDIEELTNYLDDGRENTERRRNLEQFVFSDPRLKDDVPVEYLSHKEHYEHAIRKSCILIKKLIEWQELTNSTAAEVSKQIWESEILMAIFQQNCPFSLHFVMFLPAILSQGTLEQQKKWATLGQSHRIIGTYAQTELGHGTYIRGLETTCTYDSSTEEFILNSPTLTSYKWWPGGLGHSCNYAIVVAQLYTQGTHRGLHPFIVQIRDSETWMPMPGITVGEIGSKFGLNSTNNGYVAFDNVRIPRMQMLMKNSVVHKDGTYEVVTRDILTYSTMVFVRVKIAKTIITNYLKSSAVIAIRYSAIRRQSKLKPGEREPQILDYQTQQYKLFPTIATCLVYTFAAKWLCDKYSTVNSDIERGDLQQLPELHAMACCLKAVCTADAATGVTNCRLACGGHGYMTSSNLPNFYVNTTAAETYEGENTVLLLQTARFLMKSYDDLQMENMPLSKTMSYLRDYKDLNKFRWTTTLECMASAFYQVARSKIEDCYSTIKRLVISGVTQEDAWNQTSIKLTHASEAHCRALVIDVYLKTLQTPTFSTELMKVLIDLGELICAYWIINQLGDFLQFSNLQLSDVPSVQLLLEDCLKRIRPNAVGLVDSFDIHDEVLDSSLGCYDGNVYERIFEEAKKSPLNKEPVNRSFELYMKPFIKSNM